MTQANLETRTDTYSDQLLGFSIPSRNARGRLVRLDDVLGEILSAHNYPPPVAHLLGEALVVTSLIGGLLKGEQAQVTLQAQAKGGVATLLVCDFRNGNLRGYVEFDEAKLESVGSSPTLETMFGEGFLALTIETGAGKRYQGIVPLEGESIGKACELYFVQSEQVPTLIRTASEGSGTSFRASGFLVQHLAEGEEGRERLHVKLDHPEWEHVAIMGGSIGHAELLDRGLSLETIVWRLFHEEDEVRVQSGASITRGCRCTVEHYESVLRQFPVDEQRDMADETGLVRVDCAFCSRQFAIDLGG